MVTKILDHAFSAGELTPELYGRVDFDKFSEGLALCRNFITLPHGPVVNRTGTEFVSAVKNPAVATRLIPFSYNNIQTFAIEVGAGYFRFHTQAATIGTQWDIPWGSTTSYLPNDLAYYGGVLYSCLTANVNSTPPGANWRTAAWVNTRNYLVGDLCTYAGQLYYCTHTRLILPNNIVPTNTAYWYAMPTGIYEIPNGYAAADLFNIRYVQSSDTLTLVHPNYPPQELRRYGATNWQLTQPSFNPPQSCPTGAVVSPSPGSPTNVTYQYVITSLAPTTLEESIASVPARSGVALVGMTGITVANPCVITTAGPHGFVIGDPVIVDGLLGITQLNGNCYNVDSVPTPNTLTLSVNGVVVDTTAMLTGMIAGGALWFAGIKSDLTVAGSKNTITWAAPPGTPPVRYKVYRLFQGIYGYIGQAAGTTFVDQNITPDTSQTPPLYDTTFASAGNYPASVTYYQQRRVFGATATQPQNLWMTKSGTESNMSYSIPTAADNRIAIRIAAREASAILHLVPAAQLVMLTASVEWTVTSSGGAITPGTISVAPQSYNGAGPATPVVVGNLILYASARGGHIRELSYSWQASGYISADISLLAPHLFDYSTINDLSFCRGPIPTLWAVSSTGDLLGMTYVPEQKVAAWHHHDTGINDSFESSCVVTENNEDMLYVVVNRTINGAQVRYVERLHTRNFPTLADAFFVDSGMTYNGAPTTTVSGLTWLIGMTVNILADGAVSPPQVVDATGTITLPAAASIITVGLPITAQIRTLPMAAQTDSALGQGRPKSVNKAWIRVYRSSGIQAGPDLSKLTAYAQRTTEPYGSAPNLISDEVAITLTPTWGRSGQIYIQQSDPLPLDIASIALEVSMGG